MLLEMSIRKDEQMNNYMYRFLSRGFMRGSFVVSEENRFREGDLVDIKLPDGNITTVEVRAVKDNTVYFQDVCFIEDILAKTKFMLDLLKW